MGLTSRDRHLVAATAILMPLTMVVLPRLGYRRTCAALARFRKGPLGADSAAHIAACVDKVAMRLTPHRTCLPRALVLQHLLRRRGIDSQVCFGVRTDDPGIAAHAWVEVDGAPVGSGPDNHLPFQSVPVT